MKSNKVWEIVTRINDNLETPLWAILLAFVIYSFVFIIPNVSETQAHRERVRLREIAAENAAFCEKLNMRRATDKYNQCLLDVGQFRLSVEKRVLDIVY